jgi:uncharacterized metal-binding protein YceD (DUF177 family)
MLKIYIHGLKDGNYDIHLKALSDDLQTISEEFIGEVIFTGKMRIIGKRYAITGTAECLAKFQCDLSLREFQQNIQAEMNCTYLANNELFYMNRNNGIKETAEIIIHEDEKYIDLTTDIVEELMVHLPMRRIHPDLEGKELEDLYPQYSASLNNVKDQKIDDRWEALKGIKFEND